MKKILSSLVLIVFIIACKKTELPVQPEQEIVTESSAKKGGTSNPAVTTTSVYVGSAIAALASGNVGNGNGNTVTERGFCYSTSPGPTIANDTARAGAGAGNFQRSLAGLPPATTYYVKAYAIKSGTVYYGNELSFTTLSLGMPSPGVGIVYDIDGNAYNTYTYGTQVWMLENLKTTRYRNGNLIPNVTDNTAWVNTISGAYCDYANNSANVTDYGRLYNIYAVKDSRNIAPAGWHIANDDEWRTLLYYLGGEGVAGGRMKEAGFAHWLAPNTGADNSSGFKAFGSGGRDFSTASFYGLKTSATWWSSSSSISNPTLLMNSIIEIGYNHANYTQYGFGNVGSTSSYGYAVRCIKD